MIIPEIILLIILAAIAVIVIRIILELGSTLFKIALHLIAGWVLLAVVNILPGINVPVNLLTVAISGFGGVIGTFILVLFYLLF